MAASCEEDGATISLRAPTAGLLLLFPCWPLAALGPRAPLTWLPNFRLPLAPLPAPLSNCTATEMDFQEASSADFLKPLQVTERANRPKKDRWADFSPLKCIQNSPDRAPKRPPLITVSSSPTNKRSPFKLSTFRPSQLTFTSPIMKKAKGTPSKHTPGKHTPGKKTPKKESHRSPKPAVPCRSLFAAPPTDLRTPIDWSLKTHVKFTSSKSFPYRNCFSAREESTGITSFARCNHQANGNASGGEHKSTLASSSIASPSQKFVDYSSSSSLRQHTIVWQFPNLPWLQLYPRMGRLASSTSKSGATSSLPTQAIEALQTEFKVSLKSLYHLVRTRQSAFFYLCSPNFTALFRSAGVSAALDQVHVLIYPTSSGFRKALRREGISFSSPYSPEESNDNTCSNLFTDETTSSCFDFKENQGTAKPKDGEDEQPGEDEDEDANAILDSLGLSQHDFPTLKSAKLKRRPTGQTFDPNDYSSLVVVLGHDLQLLVNLLCDQVQKYCVSPNGPLANIPPTLLSPVAFTGGSLMPLRIKASTSTLPDGSNVHKLDIHGPMLPSSLYSLCEFLRHSQEGSLIGNFLVHEQTEVFASSNSLKFNPINAIFLQESLVSTGLTDQLVTDLCNKDSQAKRPIREIRFENGQMSLQ